MRRSRLFLLAGLLAAVALVTSGCFQIRSFSLNRKSLTANEVARVDLKLFPLSMASAENQAGRVVLLIGTDDIAYTRASRFDLGGNWGGPVGRASNNALRDLMRSGGVCSANGVDAQEITGFTWRAIISSADLGAESPTAAQLDDALRVNVSFKSPADVSSLNRGNIVIFSGVWDDGLVTNDGIPQAGEVACTGLISFSIPYAPLAS
jgi:hypothetical protein